MNLLTKVLLEGQDQLRRHPAARTALYYRALRKARSLKSRDARSILSSIEPLCSAARLAPSVVAMQKVEAIILERVGSVDLSKVDWREFVPSVERRRIEKAVVLKPCVGPKEKGVVLISFEDQWARLLETCNLREFAESYTLVLSPTWSPPHCFINCLFPAVYPGPLFCLISNTDDLTIFPRLSNRYVMTPLFASNWVNPDLYKPVPFQEKDFDVVMLANFGKYKRHFLLFKALRDMPASVRVLLLGRDNGNRDSETIMTEARAYGVEGRFQLLLNAPDAIVFDGLSRAKTSLIFSDREGSCVAVAESMFANTPVGMFEDAKIGSRAFINECTGRFLQHRDLARQLLDFVAGASAYAPRAWAEKNISCFHSTTILNDTLKTHALASGQEWSQDIAVHHWRQDPQLLLAADRARMQPAYDDIESRFGIALGTNELPQLIKTDLHPAIA
jgi:glycosyltransferase involved in cell wall biosynthesis